MHAELEPVAVLADQLQANGDPRGELLALELAAALASEVDESRRLCREATQVRERIPDVAWPRALRGEQGLLRAGLLVTGTWSPSRAPELPASLDPSCRSLVLPLERDLGLRSLADAKLRLDGLWEGPNTTLFALRGRHLELDLDPEQSLRLAALGVARPILCGLEQLHFGSAVVLAGELLAVLPRLGLRSLTGHVASNEQLRAVLDACPQLEALDLRSFTFALEPIPGLERLRSLALVDSTSETSSGDRLPDGLALARLESLLVSKIDRADVERISALPRLRRLTVLDPLDDPNAIIEAIARLESLEHVALLWRHGAGGDPAPLARLPRLRTLILVGGLVGELDAPASLESLTLGWSSATDVRVRGTIPTIQSDGYFAQLQANVELRGTRVLGLSRVQRDLELFGRALERLDALDTLLLEDAQLRPDDVVGWLRTIAWPNLSFDEQRQLSQRLGHLQILGADEARLRRDWTYGLGLDPLAPHNWPKLD